MSTDTTAIRAWIAQARPSEAVICVFVNSAKYNKLLDCVDALADLVGDDPIDIDPGLKNVQIEIRRAELAECRATLARLMEVP